MAIIRVENGCKQYGSKIDSKVVMSDLNMNVQKGSIYALMGASGCGKTTLISCVVGMNQLDSGIIKVFGDDVGKNNAKIGYMPQEMALIQEFSIREIINFFGMIFGLATDKIDDRLSFLEKLLDLPDQDKIIRKCSGGQQRRVSLAVALLHDPEILILDEPTVGVDPLLRARIWEFLVDLTKTKNTTIFMTTHYIEEARNSTHVGLMRQGILVAEDTPLNLLTMINTDSLEEAFLRLSEKQESDVNVYGNRSRKENLNERSKVKAIKAIHASTSNGCKLRALIMKNIVQLVRNPGILIFALLVPFVGIICLNYSIGGKIEGLSIGIVNDEASFETCSNSSLKTFEIKDDKCLVNNISCRFVNEINDSIAITKYFETWDDARSQTKKAKIIGFVQFEFNFTDSFVPLQYKTEIDKNTNNGVIKVFLDRSDLNTVTFIERNLYNIYHRFVKKLMVDCEKEAKAWSIPMSYETFNGDLEDEFTNAMVPGFLVASLFTLSSYLTSLVLVEERRSGIWNRALTAGVKPHHFLTSHIVTGFMIMFLQTLEFIVYAVYVGKNNDKLGHMILISILLITTGLAGILYGLCVSAFTDSVVVAACFSLILGFPFLSLSGILWPLQGLNVVFKFVGSMLTFTFPARSFRNLMFTGFAFSNPVIYMGFVVNIAWIFVELLICLWLSSNAKSTNKIY